MSLLLLLPPSIIEPFALPICTTRQSFDLPYFHTTKEYFHFHDIAQNWNLINLPYIQISVLSRGCLFCVEFGYFFLLLHYGIYVCCLLPRTPTKRSNTLIDLIERVVRKAIFIMHKLREFFDPEGIHPLSKLKPHVLRPSICRSISWTETLKYSCTAHIISHYLPETIKPSHFQGSLPGMQLPAVVRNHYPKHRKIFHLGTFSVCLWQEGEEGMEMTKAQSKH